MSYHTETEKPESLQLDLIVKYIGEIIKSHPAILGEKISLYNNYEGTIIYTVQYSKGRFQIFTDIFLPLRILVSTPELHVLDIRDLYDYENNRLTITNYIDKCISYYTSVYASY